MQFDKHWPFKVTTVTTAMAKGWQYLHLSWSWMASEYVDFILYGKLGNWYPTGCLSDTHECNCASIDGEFTGEARWIGMDVYEIYCQIGYRFKVAARWRTGNRMVQHTWITVAYRCRHDLWLCLELWWQWCTTNYTNKLNCIPPTAVLCEQKSYKPEWNVNQPWTSKWENKTMSSTLTMLNNTTKFRQFKYVPSHGVAIVAQERAILLDGNISRTRIYVLTGIREPDRKRADIVKDCEGLCNVTTLNCQ